MDTIGIEFRHLERFITFPGEDLYKRSENDRVLEYVIDPFAYEIMIWERYGLIPIPETLSIYIRMLDW